MSDANPPRLSASFVPEKDALQMAVIAHSKAFFWNCVTPFGVTN